MEWIELYFKLKIIAKFVAISIFILLIIIVLIFNRKQ